MGATGIKLFARMPDDSIVMRDHTGDYEQVAARMLAFYGTAEKICEYLLHDKLADGDEESRSDFGGAFYGPARVVTRTQLPTMDSNDEDAVQMGFHNRWFWRDVNDRIGWTPFVTTTFNRLSLSFSFPLHAVNRVKHSTSRVVRFMASFAPLGLALSIQPNDEAVKMTLNRHYSMASHHGK